MNGENLVLDTNVVLYFLSGDAGLLPILENRFLFISVITEMELLSYQHFDQEEQTILQNFINDCTVANLTDDIKARAFNIRRTYSLKLPDSIILATSISIGAPLLTADQDFENIDDGDLILYS